MSTAWSRRIVSELDAADRRAEALTRGLTPGQLNWQPRPGAWSIGQCLEHLRIGNEVYLPAIAAALEGREQAIVDEIALGWFSRWFIRNFIAPNPGGSRARAPKKVTPGPQPAPDILDAYLRSNQAARELTARASAYDVNRIRFRNPFIAGLRFTVGTGLEITAKHQARHLLQAEAVRQSPGFPD